MSKLRDFLDMMSCCDLSKREIIEHFGITACCAAWKQKKHLIMKETSADKPSHQAASKPLYLKKKNTMLDGNITHGFSHQGVY